MGINESLAAEKQKEARKQKIKIKSKNEISHLFKHNALGVGGTSQRIGLEPGAKMHLLVSNISPTRHSAVPSKLATCLDSTRFTALHTCQSLC
jgi:hypothetical protein